MQSLIYVMLLLLLWWVMLKEFVSRRRNHCHLFALFLSSLSLSLCLSSIVSATYNYYFFFFFPFLPCFALLLSCAMRCNWIQKKKKNKGILLKFLYSRNPLKFIRILMVVKLFQGDRVRTHVFNNMYKSQISVSQKRKKNSITSTEVDGFIHWNLISFLDVLRCPRTNIKHIAL